MLRLLTLLVLFINSAAFADAPVIWSGTTAKWLPSGLQAAGLCKMGATGVQTTYTTNGLVLMASGVPGAATTTGSGSVVLATTPTLVTPRVAEIDDTGGVAFLVSTDRTIKGAAGQTVIDLPNFLLKDNNGYAGVAWNTNILTDSNNAGSVYWLSRLLKNASGTTLLDWSGSTASLTGNASTATALAANPSDCSAGQKATAIAANGNLTCSAVDLTADVSGTLPSGNLPANIDYIDTAQTITAAKTNSTAGAASTSAMKLSGTPYAAGTATTNKPQLLIEYGSPTTTNWPTVGSVFGINQASGSTNDFLAFQVNAAKILQMNYQGGFVLWNTNDNANYLGSLTLCNGTANPASNANCTSLYQSGGTTFKLYSPNATQGVTNLFVSSTATGAMTIGGTTPSATGALMVQVMPYTAYNAYNTLEVKAKTSQTGDLQQWQDSSAVALSKVDITGKGFFVNLRDTGLGAGVVRSSSSGDFTAAELSGDVTTSASNATTVAKIQSTTVSGTTGTVNVVFSTSPTITTPTIAKLANLTTNGFVKTSGSDGTLGVQTSPIPAADINSGRTINAQTGTTYTFVLADASNAGGFPLVTGSNASAETFTVPPQSSVVWLAGAQIDVCQIGAGKLTLAQGSGVTINSKSSNKAIGAQYVCVSLVRTASDTWLLTGDLIP